MWFRSLFQKKNAESIYNDDIISALARRVNKNHPGLINHKIKIIDSIFYNRLKDLKEAADCFEYDECPFREECKQAICGKCYKVESWKEWLMRDENDNQ